MRKFVSCICICLALVVAVMPLCAFKCADVPNAPVMVENRPVMASNRPFVQPVVQPLNQWEFPPFNETTFNADNVVGTYILDLSLPNGSMITDNNPTVISFTFNLRFTNCHFVIRRFDSNSIVFSEIVSGSLSSSSSTDFIVFSFSQNTSGELSSYYYKVRGAYSGTNINLTVGYKYFVDFIPLDDDSSITFATASSFAPNTGLIYRGLNNQQYSASLFSSSAFDILNSNYTGLVFYPYVPEPEPTVIETLIDIMISGITAFAENIGKGINDVVVNVFVDTSQETFALTTFGGVVAVFAGLALAVGLSKVVSSFIMRLGGKE